MCLDIIFSYMFIWIINSSPPSATYMRQWTGPSLVEVMACHLFAAKPLPEPMLSYCLSDSWEQMSMQFEQEFYNFLSRKCIWKSQLPKWWPFCPVGDELTRSQLFNVGPSIASKFFANIPTTGIVLCHRPVLMCHKGLDNYQPLWRCQVSLSAMSVSDSCIVLISEVWYLSYF